jgi:hypothetical protein
LSWCVCACVCVCVRSAFPVFPSQSHTEAPSQRRRQLLIPLPSNTHLAAPASTISLHTVALWGHTSAQSVAPSVGRLTSLSPLHTHPPTHPRSPPTLHIVSPHTVAGRARAGPDSGRWGRWTWMRALEEPRECIMMPLRPFSGARYPHPCGAILHHTHTPHPHAHAPTPMPTAFTHAHTHVHAAHPHPPPTHVRARCSHATTRRHVIMFTQRPLRRHTSHKLCVRVATLC